jgi:hypothetical protein
VVYSKQAGEELGVKEEVVSRDLGKLLWKLEELQRQMIQKTLEPKEQEVTLGAEERAEALGLLRDPRLLERILDDLERCGVVGEETNKLASYVAVVSRLLDAPLAVLVQSSSAAGKSALMEAVLAMLPEEQRVQYSAMTGQSLFYMGETDLKHKVLAIVEEEGAARATYALKLLQSEGVLTIASTGKDASTGRLITHQYRVEGPVMLFLTTTAIDLDEELLNRCPVLTVDEDRLQTQAIHKKQREAQTLEGLLARRVREEILRVHQNAQRLLKPLFVANPYARELTFLDSQTHCDTFGRGLFGRFGHFLTPNSRRISSWGMPSPRASEARARSSPAAVSGVSSSSSTGASAREKGSSMASSKPTTAESCVGGSRSISSLACSLVSAMNLPFLPFSHRVSRTAYLSCAVAMNLSIVVSKARCS